MATKAKRSLNEGQLVAMIARKYAGDAFACIAQLRSGVGFDKARTADAVVFSLWPSRGLELYGFECKSSRSDWQKELATPQKAEMIQKFCHRWWVVTGRDDIVHAGELPANWGLLVPSKNGQGLTVKQAAPLLKPDPPSLSLVCSIMRQLAASNVGKDYHRDEVRRARSEGFKDGQEDGQEDVSAAGQKNYKRAHDEVLQKMLRFEKRSGIKLGRYNWEERADAVKLIDDHLHRTDAKKLLERQADELARAAKELRKHLEEITEAEKAIKGEA